MSWQRSWVCLGLILLGAGLLAGCSDAVPPIEDLLVLHSITLIDPHTGTQTENATILIEGERITAIEDAMPSPMPDGAQVIDGTGKWVVAGFVDIHTHDASEAYLRTMLAWGITASQLMPNEPPESPLAMEKASESADTRSPRLQVTKMFTREFPDNLLPGVYQFQKPENEHDARLTVRALHASGYRQIKIVQDDSLLWSGPDLPAAPIEKAVFDALVDEARAQQMRVYVHATQKADTEMGAEAGVDAFLHGTMDAELEVETWKQMAAAGTVWAPTFHAVYWFGDRRIYAQRLLSDPRLTVFLPEDEHELFRTQAQSETPIAFEALRTLVDQTGNYIDTMTTNTRFALAAGVPLALGSDGGPAGASTHLEMELLQESGISPMDVLAAATYGGAVGMGRQAELGSIEVGKLADLVVLNADPRIDIRNCRAIHWVIKGGTAYRPHDLAAAPAKENEAE